MPVYDYQCQCCGHILEYTHGIHIKLRNVCCPGCCQWAKVKRLIGHSAFILKGPGWSRAGYQEDKNAQKGQ